MDARKLIVSLLPGATEMVVAVGAESQLVGVSHECDWPLSVASLPRVTTTPVDASRSSGEIHRAVQDAVAAGRSVIGIDATILLQLKPQVIITQQLCDVCAVADGEAHRLAAVMERPPEIVVLQGTTLGGVWEDIRAVGAAVGHTVEGDLVAQELELQVEAVASRYRPKRPRVVAIEWLDPLFLAGHWVPEMIHAAGGIDVGATAGSHSVIRSWEDVAALQPDVVLVILCGFDAPRARRELAEFHHPIGSPWLARQRVVVLDGNAFTSRPGPRLVEGIGIMERGLGGRDFRPRT